ncbi:uncharacterized protein [Chelonus insularis]|uniref:uncharacterized protein n=1 Tax=Chelonus insularis TaxID=460826 RepID=UPI00158EAA1E|nr:uncharacterized protein LOC118067006 [Chelonus insularis]
MESVEDLQLQFYIVSGIVAAILVILFILIIILFIRVSRLSIYRSNQTTFRQDSIGDFCYTNPMIVPGEELSRRGYSMYRAESSPTIPTVSLKHITDEYGTYESRSRF